MGIEPDNKDWTWVLERRCDDCGYDARSVGPEQVSELFRDNAGRWRALLADPQAGERPSPDRWSALEYACHVRDVYRLTAQRVEFMLTQDDPTFANWDQDETAIGDRYGEQDPTRVADELEAAAAAVVATYERLDPAARQRTGTRSDGPRFTVESFGRYVVHDVVHHVHDVETGLARLAPGGV